MDDTPSEPSFSGMKIGEMDREKDLTSKFLSGEMSFADYSNEWYDQDDEEDIDDVDREDLESNILMPTKQRGLKRRRRCLQLSPALLGLMGEANLRFVRGDKETAEKMCHEVIKLAPIAPEPYQTLAQIHENDVEKALQFSLLAAYLSPYDANEWLRLAAISKQRNDVKQEMICYTQAITADPHNIDTHMKRIELLSKLEEIKYPVHNLKVTKVRCYHRIVNCLPPSQSETILKYAKLAATIYHSNNESERVLEVMTTAYKKCASAFTMEDINIFLEILIAQKKFQTCLEIFVADVGVEIEAEIQTIKNPDGSIHEHTNYVKCSIPNGLPIDLKSKLLVCFIYLEATNLVKTLLDDFLSNDVEKTGDLYMDIEEALSAVGHHEMAMQLLDPLVQNNSFDLGAVWLKHAECLYNLGREDDAIESYYKVLKHAPRHAEAHKRLFEILEKKGRIDEALKTLQQDYRDVVSAKLLHDQCVALKKYNRMLKYLEVGEALLSKTFVKFRRPEEFSLAYNKPKAGIDLIYEFRTMRGEKPYHEDDLHFDEEENFKLSSQEEWSLFVELLNIACEHKQYFTMQRLAFGGIMSKNILSHRLEIEFFCLQACLIRNDYQNAFRFIREFAQKYPGPRSWNLLNLVINSVEENTHSKFLSRLFQKDYHVVKSLFLGNNFLASGRYLVALKYFLEYHDQCREPLSALLIAITILVMAAQRTFDKHHNLILQGMSYLMTYKKLRRCDQETYYNMGRAFQMFSINNLAIEYYERALACTSVTVCDKHGCVDLTRETAFNLYILYKDHAPDIARKYILKYLVIE
ncbi:general transcription factor 3C polypeptide 3 [Manduca sexta]|uniref:General transcription factor 3C polypeptide 3 n=1 Tax=Manduca sexta TaxID=7130 RepID=A0A922CU89_MANSE|nr:general transcription factor 3C polypeptide 3 [Manduca sexta]KAG6458133.1 hypothetical protein O3G_MSEX010713 [Manduca sexta]